MQPGGQAPRLGEHRHPFPGEAAPPPLFQTAIGAGRMVLEQYDDIASREAIQAYFHTLLELKGAEAQDIYGILPKIRTELFPFQSVAERFHMIDSPTRTVYIPLGAGAELVGRLPGRRAEPGAVPPARPIRRIYLRKPLRRPGPGRGSGAAGGWLRHPCHPVPLFRGNRAVPGGGLWESLLCLNSRGAETLPSPAPLCLLINIHFYISIHACCDRKYYITCVNKKFIDMYFK